MCLDVRGDPECSDRRPMVDPYQHHFEWGFSDGDDDHNTLRSRRLELGFEFEPWIRLHRNLHRCDGVSCWSGIHGLHSSGYAAFLQRRSLGFMFSDDLGVRTRSWCAGTQVSFQGQSISQKLTP